MSNNLKKLVSLILISVIMLIIISGVNAEDIVVDNTDVTFDNNDSNEYCLDNRIGNVFVNDTSNQNSNGSGVSVNITNITIAGNIAGAIMGNCGAAFDKTDDSAGNIKIDFVIDNQIESNFYDVGSIDMNFNIDFWIKKNDISNYFSINKNNTLNYPVYYSFSENNISRANVTGKILSFKLFISVFNYDIGFNLSFEFKYSTVKTQDINIFDSNFPNIVSYDYKLVLENQNANYTFLNSKNLADVIYRNTTKEIINSAVTVYESDFARNSLLRITNESIVDDYKMGIFTVSIIGFDGIDTAMSKINVSLFHYKILSESMIVSKNNSQFTWNFIIFNENFVDFELLISKNNIDFNMTIDDSLVIDGNLL